MLSSYFRRPKRRRIPKPKTASHFGIDLPMLPCKYYDWPVQNARLWTRYLPEQWAVLARGEG